MALNGGHTLCDGILCLSELLNLETIPYLPRLSNPPFLAPVRLYEQPSSGKKLKVSPDLIGSHITSECRRGEASFV
jgi:hypothetical protein